MATSKFPSFLGIVYILLNTCLLVLTKNILILGWVTLVLGLAFLLRDKSKTVVLKPPKPIKDKVQEECDHIEREMHRLESRKALLKAVPTMPEDSWPRMALLKNKKCKKVLNQDE